MNIGATPYNPPIGHSASGANLNKNGTAGGHGGAGESGLLGVGANGEGGEKGEKSKMTAEECVDYLSYKFDAFDLHQCWRVATRKKDSISNGRR